MKLELYDKTVEVLNDLRNQLWEYNSYVNRFKTTLTPEDNIYIFDGYKENIILEVKDEHTVINYVNMLFNTKSVGAAYVWDRILNRFANGLGKKLGHKVNLWDKQKLSLFEKISEATEDLKKGPDHERIVKDYHTVLGSEGQIYVYDSGTILFEIKDEKKVINKGEFRGLDPVWDQLVDIFVHSLEEKLGDKVKLKNKLFQ